MKKRVILSIGLATAILTGCGSSSDPTTTGTGYYIDSAVSGVDYVCGSQSGKTGSDGSFTFEKGKDCTFSLGSMKLREVKAATLKDQIKVIEDNLAVATLLQTLDSDGDPNNNGIVISAKIVEELKAKNITKLPTNQDEVAEIYEVIKNVDGYKGKLKSEDEAQTHLAKAQGTQLKELLAGKTFYNVSSKDYYLDELSFNKTLTSLTWKTLYGNANDVGDTGTESFEVKGNKIFVEEGNFYIEKETSDYLLIKGDTEGGDSRFYFDKVKAKAYFDNLEKGGSDNDNPNDLKSLLAGKTLYRPDNHNGEISITIYKFNADMTSLTGGKDEVGNTPVTLTINNTTDNSFSYGNAGRKYSKVSQTNDYIVMDYFENDIKNDTYRFYFDKTKAKAYLNTIGILRNEGSIPSDLITYVIDNAMVTFKDNDNIITISG